MDLVKYLVSHGADITAQDNQAFIKTSGTFNIEILDYLLDQGADIHAQGDYCLEEAAENSCLETIQYLISKGANIKKKGGDVVWTAVEKLDYGIIEYMYDEVETDSGFLPHHDRVWFDLSCRDDSEYEYDGSCCDSD
mmetsp:Transcript_29574/g.36546  ORF Transcript_29574/g.36546 Transcript_29574/m.36546 type:complete len:137 (-) Transcript_29574:76-486(-)